MAPPSADDSILTVVGTSQQSTKMIQKTLDGPPLAAKTVELLETENEYSVGGFAPIPAFFQSGKGSIMIVSSRIQNPWYIEGTACRLDVNARSGCEWP